MTSSTKNADAAAQVTRLLEEIAALEKRVKQERARVLRLARMSLKEAGVDCRGVLDELERKL